MQTKGTISKLADVELEFKPCTVTFTPDGQFVLVGGTSRGVRMFTREGVAVETVFDKDSWVWACACRPCDEGTALRIACGCEDGTISLQSVELGLAHSLYKVRCNIVQDDFR